jgi:hypothetical protein
MVASIGCLYLGSGVAYDTEIRVRGGAVHITRMTKKIGGTPEELYPGLFLPACSSLNHIFQIIFRFPHTGTLRSQITVVESNKTGCPSSS